MKPASRFGRFVSLALVLLLLGQLPLRWLTATDHGAKQKQTAHLLPHLKGNPGLATTSYPTGGLPLDVAGGFGRKLIYFTAAMRSRQVTPPLTYRQCLFHFFIAKNAP